MTKKLTVRSPEKWVKEIDELLKDDELMRWTTRNHFILCAIIEKLVRERKISKEIQS